MKIKVETKFIRAQLFYLHVLVFLHQAHRPEWLALLRLSVPFELVHVILLVVVEPVYSMCNPELVAVGTLEMPLVALASLEHNHNENRAEPSDILDIRVVVGPHIHFGNLALVELEVVAMYDFPDLTIGPVMYCYVDCDSDHCS